MWAFVIASAASVTSYAVAALVAPVLRRVQQQQQQQCSTVDDLQRWGDTVEDACCGSGHRRQLQGGSGCAAGFPPTCVAGCAAAFPLYFEACEEQLNLFGGAELATTSREFYDLCGGTGQQPECSGHGSITMFAASCPEDDASWDGIGYGGCTSYAHGGSNNAYCHMDGATHYCPAACSGCVSGSACECDPGAGGVICEIDTIESNAACAAGLLAFRESGDNGGADWPAATTGWSAATQDVCDWFGVTCDSATAGAVTELDLTYNSGLSAAEYHAVTGDVGHLAACTELRYLDLHWTGVSGDVAPLAACTGLTLLDTQSTDVRGDVASLAALTQLTSLHLYHTDVGGSTAALVALTQLTSLNLEGTSVSGSAAFADGLNGMSCSSSTMPACCGAHC